MIKQLIGKLFAKPKAPPPFWRHPSDIHADRIWEAKWPGYCAACGGWGQFQGDLREGTVVNYCNAMPEGQCHRCGAHDALKFEVVDRMARATSNFQRECILARQKQAAQDGLAIEIEHIVCSKCGWICGEDGQPSWLLF
jgi:hypothetical protein